LIGTAQSGLLQIEIDLGVGGEGYSSYITQDVFDMLHKSAKFGNNGVGGFMWESRTWNKIAVSIHRSNWWWNPN
jgi:hypothetical protein